MRPRQGRRQGGPLGARAPSPEIKNSYKNERASQRASQSGPLSALFSKENALKTLRDISRLL